MILEFPHLCRGSIRLHFQSRSEPFWNVYISVEGPCPRQKWAILEFPHLCRGSIFKAEVSPSEVSTSLPRVHFQRRSEPFWNFYISVEDPFSKQKWAILKFLHLCRGSISKEEVSHSEISTSLSWVHFQSRSEPFWIFYISAEGLAQFFLKMDPRQRCGNFRMAHFVFGNGPPAEMEKFQKSSFLLWKGSLMDPRQRISE